ncbi:MAG TPA: YkoF family thiamine/hydroxymethylpyrimidine-binding protein [Steroidobacteraceae bacterium]|nr:YkoF family thiamine/hydroxymethylpyrimidine-binding protein [Steroidobacteraceae bacterium]
MRIAVEISLYPLNADFVPSIQDFIDRLNAHPGLDVKTNPMSTQIAGDHQLVFDVLARETATSFAQHGRKVFVLKILGGDAPVR